MKKYGFNIVLIIICLLISSCSLFNKNDDNIGDLKKSEELNQDNLPSYGVESLTGTSLDIDSYTEPNTGFGDRLDY